MKKIVIIWPETIKEFGCPKFYSEAFTKKGFDVTEFSLNGNFIDDKIFLTHRAIIKTGFKNNNYNARYLKNYEIIKYLKKNNPEFILFFRAERIDFDFLQKIKNVAKCPLYNYFTDHPLVLINKISNYFNFFKIFDAFFVFSVHLIPVFYQLGAKRVSCVYFAASYPNQFLQYSSKKLFDLSYFGAYGKVQEKWMNFESLNIFGPNWPKSNKFYRNGGKEYEMSKFINKSKLVVNFTRAEHGCFPTMKTFEIPAASSLMITNETEEKKQFFENEKSVLFYNSYYELIDIIKFIIKRKNLIKSISENAFRQVKDHTYFNRSQDILNFFNHHDK